MTSITRVEPGSPGDRPRASPASLDVLRRLVAREDGTGGRTTWMALGACRASDPELFFPISAAGSSVEQVSVAKAVCARCAVSEHCRSYALRTMPDGIWGGTTREERAAERVRRAVRPQGQAPGTGPP